MDISGKDLDLERDDVCRYQGRKDRGPLDLSSYHGEVRKAGSWRAEERRKYFGDMDYLW